MSDRLSTLRCSGPQDQSPSGQADTLALPIHEAGAVILKLWPMTLDGDVPAMLHYKNANAANDALLHRRMHKVISPYWYSNVGYAR
jgi:hypothetical protein